MSEKKALAVLFIVGDILIAIATIEFVVGLFW